MSRRMTIVFDDEELYTRLKVEAARTHRPAKAIVAAALNTFFEAAAEGQGAVRTRAGVKHDATPGGTSVDEILEQLGLTKETSASPAR